MIHTKLVQTPECGAHYDDALHYVIRMVGWEGTGGLDWWDTAGIARRGGGSGGGGGGSTGTLPKQAGGFYVAHFFRIFAMAQLNEQEVSHA